MTNHPNRSRKEITLQICVYDDQDRVTFCEVGDVYPSREKAMVAAKKLAGKGARYTGDGLSVRYTGASGTVYLCE